jgi:hypothetical protein
VSGRYQAGRGRDLGGAAREGQVRLEVHIWLQGSSSRLVDNLQSEFGLCEWVSAVCVWRTSDGEWSGRAVGEEGGEDELGGGVQRFEVRQELAPS